MKFLKAAIILAGVSVSLMAGPAQALDLWGSSDFTATDKYPGCREKVIADVEARLKAEKPIEKCEIRTGDQGGGCHSVSYSFMCDVKSDGHDEVVDQEVASLNCCPKQKRKRSRS